MEPLVLSMVLGFVSVITVEAYWSFYTVVIDQTPHTKRFTVTLHGHLCIMLWCGVLIGLLCVYVFKCKHIIKSTLVWCIVHICPRGHILRSLVTLQKGRMWKYSSFTNLFVFTSLWFTTFGVHRFVLKIALHILIVLAQNPIRFSVYII
jgi:hypothetical protein